MISVIDGVNERVLRIILLKNGKEVSSLSWINVLSFIHKILIFYLLNPNRHLGIYKTFFLITIYFIQKMKQSIQEFYTQ